MRSDLACRMTSLGYWVLAMVVMSMDMVTSSTLNMEADIVPLVNGVQIPYWSDDLYPSYSKVPKASVVLQLHGPALIFP